MTKVSRDRGIESIMIFTTYENGDTWTIVYLPWVYVPAVESSLAYCRECRAELIWVYGDSPWKRAGEATVESRR